MQLVPTFIDDLALGLLILAAQLDVDNQFMLNTAALRLATHAHIALRRSGSKQPAILSFYFEKRIL